MSRIRQEIREYLAKHAARGSLADVGDGDSLLSAGVIDSLLMLDVVAHLESTYGIAIGEDDMTPENFDSIASIADYVAKRSQTSQGGET